MKTRTFVSILILVLAVVIIVGGGSTKKEVVAEKEYYVPTFDEEIHGTWINEEYTGGEYQAKIQSYPWGYWEKTSPADNEVVQYRGTFVIVDKWIDSEGNIWYKTYSRQSTRIFYEINKISNNGNTWEFVLSTVKFPLESDMHPDFQLYHIYYRQE